jgi:hypothetical protein
VAWVKALGADFVIISLGKCPVFFILNYFSGAKDEIFVFMFVNQF